MKDKGKVNQQLKNQLKGKSHFINDVVRLESDIEKLDSMPRKSEQSFSEILEAAPAMIFTIDAKGDFLFTNRSWGECTGYSQEDAKSINIFNMVHPDDLVAVKERFVEVFKGDSLKDFEFKYKTRDGSYMDIQISLSPMLDSGGNVIAVCGIGRNITERTQAEEALQSSKEQFQALIENAYDVTAIINVSGGIDYISPSIKQSLGYEMEDFMGKNPFDLIHPDDLQHCIDHFTKAIQIPHYFGYEKLRFQHKNSSWRVIEATANNLLDHPSVAGVVINFRDITEREQVEDKYRNLIEEINDGYVVYQDGSIVLANRRFAELYGYEVEQVLGRDLFKFVAPERLQEIGAKYAKIISGENEAPERVEVEGIKSDGTPISVELSIKATNYEGRPAFAVIFRDVTGRKQSEEALRESEQRFKSIFDNAVDGICLAEVETHQLHTGNKVFCQMLDYSLEEFGKMELMDIHPEQDLSYVFEQFDKQARGEISLARDIPMRRRDGSIFYTDVNSSLLTIGGKIYLMGIFRDITERRNAEETVRELQEMYWSMVETADKAGEGIVIAQNVGDLEAVIVFANDEVLRIMGYTREELIGRTFRELFNPEDLSEMLNRYRRRHAGEELPSFYEMSIPRKDGTAVPIEYCVGLMTYQGKQASIAYTRDITGRKRSEEMLKKSQEKLQSILQALPDILFHISRDGTFLDEPMGQSSILEHYGGVSRVKTLHDILPGEFADGSLKAIETTLDKGTLQVVEHSAPFPLGTKAIYETRIVPFGKDEVIAISRDITDQKLFETRLRTYQQQLQSLASQLSQTEELERKRLAADLHDLIGQSLAVIKMKLNVWKNKLYSSGYTNDMTEVLELVESAINSTRSLTYDLSPPVLYELGLEAGLEYLLEQFHERHAIKYEFEDDGQKKLIEGESLILLYRCVNELLMNVVKHSKAQFVKLSVRRENSQVSITLEDDGVGFTISETEGEVKGFGLLNVRERLNWIGGSFKLQSAPGCGTHVTLKAPLKYTDDSTEGD